MPLINALDTEVRSQFVIKCDRSALPPAGVERVEDRHQVYAIH